MSASGDGSNRCLETVAPPSHDVVEHSFDPTLDIEQPFGQIEDEHPFE
jgi:hypothetical protein